MTDSELLAAILSQLEAANVLQERIALACVSLSQLGHLVAGFAFWCWIASQTRLNSAFESRI